MAQDFLNKQTSLSITFLACVLWNLPAGYLFGQTVHGTGAIAIWTPKKIVLAMDSKVRRINDSLEESHDICKIITVGKFSLAMSGIYDNPVTGYDAWELARDALSASQTVPHAALLVERAIRPKLETALLEMKRSNPVAFRREFGENYLAFFVAGVDFDSLILAGRDFVPGQASLLDVLRNEYPGARAVDADAIAISIFGERKAIDARYSDESVARLLRSQDITESATQLLQLEIDEDSAKVGAPRSIREVTKSGDKWVEHGLCKEH